MGIFTWFKGKRQPAPAPEPKNNWDMNSGASWWPMRGTVDTASGLRIDEKQALTLSSLSCGIRVISETVASIPRHVVEIQDERTSRKAVDLPLYRVLHDAPNPEQSSFTFFDQQVQACIGWGTAFGEAVRDSLGNVIQLWPIHPNRIPPRNITRNFTDDRYFGGPMIGDPGELVFWVRNDDGSETPIAQRDMLYVPGVMSENGITGTGIVKLGASAIAVAKAVEEHAGAFFRNGAAPNVAILLKKSLGKEAAERLRQQWQGAFGGVRNHYKSVVLEDDSDLKTFTVSPEDSQLVSSRQFSVVEMARLLRIPPHLMMSLERSTYSNISQQSKEFVDYSLMPWILRFEQAMFQQLLTPEQQRRYRIKFNLNGLLRGDEQSRAAFYTSLFAIGALSPNDIRALEDMNPIPGGDTYFVNGQPLGTKPATSNGKPATNGHSRLLTHSH